METRTTKPKLERQNATITKEIVDLELVRDVSHQPERSEAELRKLCKITDVPTNWAQIKGEPTYDFEQWKQSKIAEGTWQGYPGEYLNNLRKFNK